MLEFRSRDAVWLPYRTWGTHHKLLFGTLQQQGMQNIYEQMVCGNIKLSVGEKTVTDG